MKRVGIITIQKCDNYGADLQAYALGAKLRSLGYDAENIDYVFYKNPRHKGGKLESPIFRLSLANRIREALFPLVSLLRSLAHPQSLRNRRVRRRKFAAWFVGHVKCGQEYRSAQELYANPPVYDVYLVGSDQVWNPRMGSTLLPYFLDFAPAHAHCASYAASLGVGTLPTPVFLKYRALLRRFSFIGLREKRGVELLSRMNLPAQIQQTVDPTLLLTAHDWQEVAQKPANPPPRYVLLYDLIASPETVLLAQSIARQRRLPLVRIGDGAYGPGEFLWLFAHADGIVTNSFHGTVFSILNHKPFYTVVPRTMKNGSRITSLLELVGLSARCLRAADVAAHLPTLHTPESLDWETVEARLAKARQDSLDFLVAAVEGRAPCLSPQGPGVLPRVCRAVWNPDSSVRAASTSGGLFSALASAVLKKKGRVYGAAFDDDFKHVHHKVATNEAELAALRGSKYVYSEARDAIADAARALREGHPVLFTGTPCQCWAMRAAARDCEASLYTLDIVCHGTPRPDVFEAYIDELEKRYGGKIVRYEFRNKDNGWNFPSIYFACDNGKKVRRIPWLDSYFHGYSINAYLRKGCYSCPFTTLSRISDVTVGDCWRVATNHPDWDDNRGVSLVLGNTEKGVRLLREAGIWNFPGGDYALEDAEKRNEPLMQPAAKYEKAELFDEIFVRTHSFEQASSVYNTRSRMLKNWIRYWVKRLGWFYFRRHQ